MTSSSNMKVAVVCPNYPSSEGTGATHSSTQIIESLHQTDIEVSVFCTEKPDTPIESEYDLNFLDIRRGKHRHFTHELNKSIRKKKKQLSDFDVVHSYLMRSIPAIGAIGRNSNVDTIVTLNAYGGVCPKNDLLYLEQDQCRGNGFGKCLMCITTEKSNLPKRPTDSSPYHLTRIGYGIVHRMRNYHMIKKSQKFLDGISQFHALSPPVKEHYVNFGFPGDRITIIPNTFDEIFNVKEVRRFEEPYKLLYVGALRFRKGVDRLPKIATELRQKYDVNFHLTIVGEGEYRPFLEREISCRNLEERISLIGEVSYEKLVSVYADHDLFIYPGRWDEPFGRVFIEAMGTGTPIFSTDVGHVAQIVGNSGVVCPESNISDFTKQLNSVLNPERLRHLSQETSKELTKYHPENTIPQYIDMYETL